MANANILIAGCGYVGVALGQRLAEGFNPVWGLRRSARSLPKVIQPVEADLCDPQTLTNLPPKLDYVVYAASPDDHTEEAYSKTYVEGLRNLLDALNNQGQSPKRLIYVSSTGVYAQNDGEEVSEDSQTEPRRFSGRILLEGEALAKTSPFDTIIVRLSGIYGPGRNGLIDDVREGRAYSVKDRMSMVNHIHRDDCAGVIAHLMFRNDAEGVYLGVDNEPVERGELLRWVAKQLGVAEPIAMSAERAPNVRRGGYRIMKNMRLLQTGYVFHYPTYREGYSDLL